MNISRETLIIVLALAWVPAGAEEVPAPVPPMIQGAFGYVPIPNAAVAPDTSRVYKVIYDTTRVGTGRESEDSQSAPPYRAGIHTSAR